jgi:hypothetical protein
VEPEVDDRVLGIADDVVILARFDHQHLARVQWLAPAIDLDLALALHNAKDLGVVVHVISLRVRAKPDAVKAQRAVVNVRTGQQLVRHVLWPIRAQIRKLEPFHRILP